MTRDSAFTDFLEDYLDELEGPTPLPDAVRDALRAELPSIRQRPAWWPGRRFPEMNTTAKLALGVAAAALVAVVGFTVINGGNRNFGSPDPTPSPSSTPVAALAGQPDLVAGRYAIASGISMRVTAAVPNHWSAMGAWGLRGPLGYEAPGGMGIRFYTVANLLKNPGSLADGLQDPPVGPTVDDLIEAIVAQTEWTSSTPTETTVGGFSAQHVRITIPDGAEFDPSTDGGAFFLFQDEGSGQIWGLEVGQMFDVYVVDVDGERLVLDAYHYPGTSESDVAALEAVVDSIQIDPTAAASPEAATIVIGEGLLADVRVTTPRPDGWTLTANFASKAGSEPNGIGFSAWTSTAPHADPCHWADEDMDLSAEPTAEEIVATLVAQPGRDPRPPVETTLGGWPATRLELVTPQGLDISTCDLGRYKAWTDLSDPNGGNWNHASGQLDVVYVVDVDGSPVVIDSWYGEATSPEDLGELESLFEAMVIDRQ